MIGESLQKWIDQESLNLTHGELTIKLKYHDGKLQYVDKIKSEKEKINDNNPIKEKP